MNKKILHFDVETTGVDAVKNDVIQFAAIIEVEGSVVEEFEIKMQPHSYDNISPKAIETHGITIEKMKRFEDPCVAWAKITALFGRHIDKYNKSDKFFPAGYNCHFDLDFVNQLSKKCGDKYFGSWMNWRFLDPLPMLYIKFFQGEIDLPDYKLETVCKYYDIDIKAHDALSDIRATREVLKILMGY